MHFARRGCGCGCEESSPSLPPTARTCVLQGIPEGRGADGRREIESVRARAGQVTGTTLMRRGGEVAVCRDAVRGRGPVWKESPRSVVMVMRRSKVGGSAVVSLGGLRKRMWDTIVYGMEGGGLRRWGGGCGGRRSCGAGEGVRTDGGRCSLMLVCCAMLACGIRGEPQPSRWQGACGLIED